MYYMYVCMYMYCMYCTMYVYVYVQPHLSIQFPRKLPVFCKREAIQTGEEVSMAEHTTKCRAAMRNAIKKKEEA